MTNSPIINNDDESTSHQHRHHHHYNPDESILNQSVNWTQQLEEATQIQLNEISSSIPLDFVSRELNELHKMDNNESEGVVNIYTLTINNTMTTPTITNHQWNSTTADPNLKDIYEIVIPPMVFLCIVTTIFNFIIAYAGRWCRRPMSPTLYFSISLAISDAYASSIVATGLIINSLLPIVYGWDTPKCISLSVEALRLGGILVIVCHLLALAVNHWIGIVRPLHYAATMTRRTAWIVIILSWSCPILFFFIYFSSVSGQGFLSEGCAVNSFMNQVAFRGLFASFFFPPLVVMTLIYFHIFIIVRRHQNERSRYQPNDQTTQQLRRNVKAVVTTVLILGTYIIGWMPATILYVLVCEDCYIPLSEYKKTPIELQIGLGIAVNALVILKVLVDPIIYAARMADIQFALRKMKYDFLNRCFGRCLPASLVTDPVLERGYSRTERSLNETKSFRMSSFGSASSTRRPFANSTNHLSPNVGGRHAIANNLHRPSCKIMNGHTKPKTSTIAEMDL